jgi:taurine dioxygenase
VYRHRTGPLTLRRSDATVPQTFELIDATPIGPTIGAEVGAVELGALTDAQFSELDRALCEYKVLFFRDQHLTPEEHCDFAARWGPLVDDQLVMKQSPVPVDNFVEFTRDATTRAYENEWHTDGTFRPVPPKVTVLRAVDVPTVGGDTLFADMAAAYDNLDEATRQCIAPLCAVHDWSIGAYASKFEERLEELQSHVPPVVHPVAIRHPRTGRATLFVNRLFTREIVGLAHDGDRCLDDLCRLAELPELQARMHWAPGSVAVWDNVAVQHYGANDYFPQVRVMARAAVAGDPAEWPAVPAIPAGTRRDGS